MVSFIITSIVASIFAARSLAAPVDSVTFRQPSGFLNSPANGTHISSASRNGIISVSYTPLHTPRVYNTESIDLYLTPYPVADFGAFVENGKKIASQLTGSDSMVDITATFGVEGFCGPHYLVVVENQMTFNKMTHNVVFHPYLMIEC